MKPKPKESPARTQSRDDSWGPVLHEIARRADQLWVERGSIRGTDLEVWLQAEREVFAARGGVRLDSGAR